MHGALPFSPRSALQEKDFPERFTAGHHNIYLTKLQGKNRNSGELVGWWRGWLFVAEKQRNKEAKGAVGWRVMRRCVRILINVATVVSLMLLIATVVLWAGTFNERHDWQWSNSVGRAVRERRFFACRGNFLLMVVNTNRGAPCTGCSIYWHWRVIGIQRCDYPPGHQWSFYIHALALCIAFASLPAVRGLKKIRRRERLASGLCRGCGYDLRATPERCPECGRVVSGVADTAPPRRDEKDAARRGGFRPLKRTLH